MSGKLKLASDLSLPLAIASQAVCLVGIRGSGKTNTAGVIAEELLDQHQQIVVLDPTDRETWRNWAYAEARITNVTPDEHANA